MLRVENNGTEKSIGKVFSYGSTNDAIEDAKCYQLSPETAKSDGFLRNLSIILKNNSSFPSSESICNKSVVKQSKLSSQCPRQSEGNNPSNQSKSPLHKLRSYKRVNLDDFECVANSKEEPLRSHCFTPNTTYKDNIKKTIMRDEDELMFLNSVNTLSTSKDDSFHHLLVDNKKAFLKFLPLVDHVQNIIPQVVEVIIRIFRCKFSEKTDTCSSVIFSGFIEKLITYMILLPTDYNEKSMTNSDLNLFLENVLSLCQFVFSLMPFKSAQPLKKVMKSIQYAVKGLTDCQEVVISEIISIRIDATFKEFSESGVTINQGFRRIDEGTLKPPNNIKSICIFPTKEDLFEGETFLRKNVVDGAYQDVEHYVDVQFRLLREDFIAPLRNGIQQLCQSLNDKNSSGNSLQFDNIRVHENVKFLHGIVRNGKFGHLVHLTKGASHYSRLMFGSLLLFTKNNFETFVHATVVDPIDNNLLVVEICNSQATIDEIYNNSYTMVESEVYFEPYFHVLEALQHIDLEHFPMKKYIVDVEPQAEGTKTVSVVESSNNLNASQARAFNAAIVNDFVAIQGPPGTGKTHLAIQLTKHILNEYRSLCDSFGQFGLDDDVGRVNGGYTGICKYRIIHEVLKDDHIFFGEKKELRVPILLVCFTNHALDQFLEGLLTCTSKIIRVGGQSKSDDLSMFNLKEIRKYWVSIEKQARRTCSCHFCKAELKDLGRHGTLLKEIEEITLSYLINLKKIESVSTKGLLKMQLLNPWIPHQFRAFLHGEQFESWLLEGAYTKHIPEYNIEEHDTSQTVHTHHLIGKRRKSTALKNHLQFDDFKSLEHKADIALCCNSNNYLFSFEIKDIQKESLNLQNKLNQLRKRGTDEDILHFYEAQIKDLNKQTRYVSYMLIHQVSIAYKRIHGLSKEVNPWSINYDDRWMLYHSWINKYKDSIKYQMKYLEHCLAEVKSEISDLSKILDIQILKSANIIGMTTTSAAKLRNVLEKVEPEIVIVEEAAEVLEAHIVASLSSTVKKVILIGDHKQLKPNTAVYQLAQKYKLDVSLFERMINNGLGCQVLDTQHRMRPEISSLIVPAIYPDLKNADSVYDRPNIRGVISNVYFITHDHPENKVSDTSSRSNTHEVGFLIAFCIYLLSQGYHPSEITVLATYAGQMTALERERQRRELASDLRISTVDNYQGEENKIILLSLVRSNAEASIGFLKTENRVCVALSRARDGLFIIGNMENLIRSSTIWQQINARLEQTHSIGTWLPLGCHKHPNNRSFVRNSHDFVLVPNGGCSVKCAAELSCGHVCPWFCHSVDPDHEQLYSCQLPCERMACEKHRCLKLCGESCGKCSYVVEKVLPCGHSANLACSKDPSKKICTVQVTVQLNCGHIIDKECSETMTPICKIPCTGVQHCGHPCQALCHGVLGVSNHQDKPCTYLVDIELECGHTYELPCSVSTTSIKCNESCSKYLPCGHPCTGLCGEKCNGICYTMVKKTLSKCGHVMKVKCSMTEEKVECNQACNLKLPCGHDCTSTCSTNCSTVVCQKLVNSAVEPACNHGLIQVPCYINTPSLRRDGDVLLQLCLAPCRAELSCGHTCTGRCGDCLQGRLHIPCTNICSRTLNCGHKCEELCSTECPTLCASPCLNRCQHRECSAPCGEPCTPCKKSCSRRCKHQRCSQACSDMCDCPPCGEPCLSLLSCGHSCVGFCGEPCPQACLLCSPPCYVITLNPNQNQRFVVLEDCKHLVDDEEMKQQLLKDTESGKVSRCPVCNEPIVRTRRYKTQVTDYFTKLMSVKLQNKKLIKYAEILMEGNMRLLEQNQQFNDIEVWRGCHVCCGTLEKGTIPL